MPTYETYKKRTESCYGWPIIAFQYDQLPESFEFGAECQYHPGLY